MKHKVMSNTSHVKFKKTEVEEHPRISSISNQTKSVTTCNDSLNSRTSNVNAVCATCGKCVFNANHDACVSTFLKDVNGRTKNPNGVPISTRKPKSQANKSVATPHKKTVASESTITNSKSYYRMLYKKTSKAWKWIPICHVFHRPLILLQIVQLILFIVDSGCTKHMTGNLSLLCNFVEKYLGTVRFGNDQFAPILGYRDLVQGNITIKRVYYVEGLNHNLFSVGQFCDADLEVAFRKSTCFVRDLQGNDLLTGNRGYDLYTISLQETTYQNPICLWLKHTNLRMFMASEYVKDHTYVPLVIYTWTLFLHSKDETLEVLKDFLTMIQRNLQAPIIFVRPDRGTEFLNKTLNAFFKEEGIKHLNRTALSKDETALSLRLLERCFRLLNFLYSFGLKQLQPHAILKTDQSSSQLMRKWHITSLMTENPQLNTFTSLVALEEVYVAQPDEFVDLDHPDKVYRLRKALYGLKQALRAWYDELSKFLISKGFTKEILKKHGMEKGQSIGTPMAMKPKLDADLSGEPVDRTEYLSKIGSLMYLTSSRPDIV
ncbi:retrovirus-related pol polyprotein from transposon TNT 1-94 [Tanacetum coccineum]